jgi:hypothetical protein
MTISKDKLLLWVRDQQLSNIDGIKNGISPQDIAFFRGKRSGLLELTEAMGRGGFDA